MTRFFDPHIHMYSRTTDDYEKMSLAGIEVIVQPSFWLGSPRTFVGTFIDYWEHMISYETTRAQDFGIARTGCMKKDPVDQERSTQPLPWWKVFCAATIPVHKLKAPLRLPLIPKKRYKV